MWGHQKPIYVVDSPTYNRIKWLVQELENSSNINNNLFVCEKCFFK